MSYELSEFEDHPIIQRSIAERKREFRNVLILGIVLGAIIGTAGYFAIIWWVTDLGIREYAGWLGILIGAYVVGMVVEIENSHLNR